MMQDQNFSDASDAQILHPGSRALFRYWETLRAERPCPTREEFELADVKTMLADMVVIDRDYLRNTFKFRLAGTRVCALFGQTLTGRNVLEGWDAFESDVISRHLLTVLNQQQPAVIRMRLTTDRGEIVAAELVTFPVQMRGSHRFQIIGGLFPFRTAQGLGHQRITARELVSARVIWTEHEAAAVPVQFNHPLPTTRPSKRSLTLISGGKA